MVVKMMLKGARKSYFTHYLCINVIPLENQFFVFLRFLCSLPLCLLLVLNLKLNFVILLSFFMKTASESKYCIIIKYMLPEGFLFFSTLCLIRRPPNFIVKFHGIGWYDQHEVLKLSTKMLSSKTQRTFSTEEFFVSCLCKVRFLPSHLSTPALAQQQTKNLTSNKVCMFKVLSRDLIKV